MNLHNELELRLNQTEDEKQKRYQQTHSVHNEFIIKPCGIVCKFCGIVEYEFKTVEEYNWWLQK